MAKKKKSILGKIEDEFVKEAQEFVEYKVKRKAIHIGEISALVIVGGLLIAFGAAFLLIIR